MAYSTDTTSVLVMAAAQTMSANNGFTLFAAGGWLGGFRYSNNQNHYAEWEVGLRSGTYELVLLHARNTYCGIYTIAVGGTTLGTTVDGYAATAAQWERDVITGITVSGGTTKVRFTMGTKNASSTGYFGQIAGFSLTRTGA